MSHYTNWPPLAPPPLAGGTGHGPAGSRTPNTYVARLPPQAPPACIYLVVASRSDYEWVKNALEIRWLTPYINGKPIDIGNSVRATIGGHIQEALRETELGLSYALFRRFPVLSMFEFKKWILASLREEGRAVLVLRDINFVTFEPESEPPRPPPRAPDWEPEPELI